MDRKTESENSLSQRIFKAEFEMKFQDEFDVVLVNADLEESLKKAVVLVEEFLEK